MKITSVYFYLLLTLCNLFCCKFTSEIDNIIEPGMKAFFVLVVFFEYDYYHTIPNRCLDAFNHGMTCESL